MDKFRYYNPSEIFFGDGAENELGKLLAKHQVRSLLLVYSGDFIKELGIYGLVQNVCEEQGITLFENGTVVPNPKIELVRELTVLGKREQIDFVLAVGGGSAIDTAKAVALGIPYRGDVWDFYSQDVQPEKALGIGVITTLPASGSETSNCSILSNGLYKQGVEHDLVIPKFAIMNPRYTLGLPAYQTACGTADILSHLLERYFSDTPHTDVTDYLIEGAVSALLINGERVIRQPGDYDVRAEIQWIASIAHNNLLDTGRNPDWGSHRIEHELSAQYDIAHGEGMAVVLLAWLRYAAGEKPDKPAQLANRVFGIDEYNYSRTEMVLKLAEQLEQFFKKLGLKTSFEQLDVREEDFEVMAMRATKNNTQTVGHYLPLDAGKIISILQCS